MHSSLLFLVVSATSVNAASSASLTGNVATTSVAGSTTLSNTGATYSLPVGTSVYGPFEAGFTSRQDGVLAGLGCATGKGYLPGGLDTMAAESVISKDCAVELPRYENGKYISLVDECGGHTRYHFHERLKCLYEQTGAHSIKLASALDGQNLYGKWEDANKKVYPKLDACGGHFGPTPDGSGDSYHYHVQEKPPFTIGCFGPNADNTLVTVEQCRALYTSCGDDTLDLDTNAGTKKYDPWCPCFDGSGSNIGTVPLAVFESSPTTAPPTAASPTTAPPTPASPTVATHVSATNKPNVIVYMTDDMHYIWPEAPATPEGTPVTPLAIKNFTPNLNKLREEGVSFSKAYSSTATCAPSRLSLLTGRFCSRAPIAQSNNMATETDTYVGNVQCKMNGADLGNNMAATLQKLGYSTFFSGKWHLEEGKSTDLWADVPATQAAVKKAGFTHADGIYIDNIASEGYTFSHNLEWSTGTALDFIANATANNQPWFVQISPTVPHSPDVWEAMSERSNLEYPGGTLSQTPNSGMATRLEMVSKVTAAGNGITNRMKKFAGPMWIDESIGAVYKKLEALGQLDNTVFVFMFDHGQAAKNVLVEAGTRIAMTIRYPKVFNAGTTFDKVVSNLDIFPTVLDIMGVPDSSVDGIRDGRSLLPLLPLVGQTAAAFPSVSQSAVSELYLDRAIVNERYKLIVKQTFGTPSAAENRYPASQAATQFYDLDADPTEQVNLATSTDATVQAALAELKKQLDCHRRVTAPNSADSSTASYKCLYTTGSVVPAQPTAASTQIGSAPTAAPLTAASPTAAAGAVDKDERCSGWTSYCTTNEYVKTNCLKTCAATAAGAIDKDERCSGWISYCTTSEWMTANCPKTCAK